jgi:glycosyltransferase involved in cell wall biosynthesis
MLDQSYEHWELLVVDDGSSDRTGEIACSYGDSRVRYFRQEHQGIFHLADTYDFALRAARGDLVAILEGDDCRPADSLSLLVPGFDDPEVVLTYGMYRSMDAKGRMIDSEPRVLAYYERFPRPVLCNDPIGSATRVMLRGEGGVLPFPCSSVIRRRALEHIRGFQRMPDGHTVDVATFLALSLEGKFFYVPKTVGHYRRHACAASSSGLLTEFAKSRFLYTRQFMEQHKEELQLSASERELIDLTWRGSLCAAMLTDGRWYLLRKQWTAARFRFWQVLRSARTVKHREVALAGWLASWLHCDIENIYRLAGAVDLRRFELRRQPE